MPVGMLEPEPPFPKLATLRAMPAFLHPLQRAIDGGAADFLIFLADEVVQIVGGQMSFLRRKTLTR